MGGGTTIVEALQLGCKVIGGDLNPVARLPSVMPQPIPKRCARSYSWEAVCSLRRQLRPGKPNKAERIAAMQQEGVIPQPLTSLTDILPAYFSDPNFDMPDELKNMHYNPTVEQMTWAALGNYDFAAGLDRLAHPMLVLWGEDDAFGMAYVETTKRALSAATVEIAVLEKCGHYWHECPDDFFSHVRAFLELSPVP